MPTSLVLHFIISKIPLIYELLLVSYFLPITLQISFFISKIANLTLNYMQKFYRRTYYTLKYLGISFHFRSSSLSLLIRALGITILILDY